jgi:malate dehydrogenase (oxaloacetate-decarboxylating)
LYLGLKQKRARGEEYERFVDNFVKSVNSLFPTALLHFEDFGLVNARTLLDKYRPNMACFNGENYINLALLMNIDDIQGTGCVAQAAVKSAVWVAKGKVADQRIVIFGAGTAGTGTSIFVSLHS